MLQKTMVVVEGMARTLDPRLDIWTTAEPVVREWIAHHLGPAGQFESAARDAAQLLARIPGHDNQLKDPQSRDSDQPPYAKNELRSRTAEFLVLIGVCTHLGCLPKQRFGAGELYPSWPGGFHCPCHGSRFDLAGRVFDGSPASTNLRVPPYSFPKPQTLVIVADEKGVAA